MLEWRGGKKTPRNEMKEKVLTNYSIGLLVDKEIFPFPFQMTS